MEDYYFYIKLAEYSGYIHLTSTMLASFLVLREHLQNKGESIMEKVNNF